MNYKISREANRDLEEIWIYTFKYWSQKQADRYLNLILDEIEFLAENPNSGKDYSHVKSGYMRSKIKEHLIFYTVNLSANQIEIIRVLHQKMDIESRLRQP